MVLKLIGVNPSAPFAPILSNMPVKKLASMYAMLHCYIYTLYVVTSDLLYMDPMYIPCTYIPCI